MYCLAVSQLEGLSHMVSEVLCMEWLNSIFHVASMLETKAHVHLFLAFQHIASAY